MFKYTPDQIDKIIENKLQLGECDHISCNLCGSDDSAVFAIIVSGKGPHYRRVRCNKCGLVYSDPQASETTLKQYYSEGDLELETLIDFHESLIPQYNSIFSDLTKKRKPGNFLDIGCSTGHFINVGRKYGWNVYGLDYSRSYVEYAKETFGLSNILQEDIFSAGYPDNHFDYVWLWHVLEHLKDPMRTLMEINRIMKPGGKLRIGVPCVKDPIYYLRFRGSDIKGFSSDPAHTYEFIPEVLLKMVKTVNFKVTLLEVYYNPGALKKLLTYRSSWKGKKIMTFLYRLSNILHKSPLHGWFGNRLAVDCIKG